MSHRVSGWAWRSPFTLGTRLVLLCLANHSGEQGVCWVSIETIMRDCNLSKSKVYEGISELVEAKWLTKGKAKLSKLVEDGLIAEDKIYSPNKEVAIWRITPRFPESGTGESVQNSVSEVPESGEASPESGKNSPESGKPPHPLIGSNHHVPAKEPSGTTTGPRPAGGGRGDDPNGLMNVKQADGTFRLETPEERLDRINDGRRAAVRRVFGYYCQKTDRDPRMYTLTDARMKVGLARLQDCWKKTDGKLEKAEELMRIAIDALTASGFHMGDNDRKRRYTDWTDHLFKSTDKLEKWLEAE